MTKKDTRSAGPPAGFFDRMQELLDPVEYEAFRAAFDQPWRAGLRVNTLKISVPDFISIAPFPLAPIGAWEPAGFFVTEESRPGRHPYHDAGLYYLQEPSAMLAAALLAAAPGEMILDLAAAPGGKATQLVSLMTGSQAAVGRSPLRRAMDEEGLLVANDVHPGRARLLADNLARWGALNVLVTQDDPARLGMAFGPVFDRVIIDAPCSGEGMIRRRESLEWSADMVAACARRQRGILDAAPDLVRPGGRLLYSTCTFAPEENEQVIAAFLAEHPDFQLRDPQQAAAFDRGRPEWAAAPRDIADQLGRAVRLWPHRFPGEGHFMALMERGMQELPDWRAGGSVRLTAPAADELRLWREFAAASLLIDIPPERLHVHYGRLYLQPKTEAIRNVRIVRYGLLLGELRRGRFHPAHDLALMLTADDVVSAVNLAAADERLAAYQAGADLAASGPDGWTLIAVDGFGLGWGKRVGDRVKNHYPHYLRRRMN